MILRYRSSRPEVFCKKKVFLEILQNSQENTCIRVSFLIKFPALPASLLKKRLWHQCFLPHFAKFLRTPYFIEHLWRLLVETCMFKGLQERVSFICNRGDTDECFFNYRYEEKNYYLEKILVYLLKT